MTEETDARTESAEQEMTLNQAWTRWAETDPSFSFAFHQQSFDLFCALNARHAAKTLMEQLPHLQAGTYERVSAIIEALSPTAEMQGALLLAVLSRKPYMAPERGYEVGLETLLKSYTALQEQDSEESEAYRQAVGEFDLLEDLTSSAVRALTDHIIDRFGELKPDADRIGGIVADLMRDGIKTEFLFTRLVNEGSAANYLVKQVLSKITDDWQTEEES